MGDGFECRLGGLSITLTVRPYSSPRRCSVISYGTSGSQYRLADEARTTTCNCMCAFSEIVCSVLTTVVLYYRSIVYSPVQAGLSSSKAFSALPQYEAKAPRWDASLIMAITIVIHTSKSSLFGNSDVPNYFCFLVSAQIGALILLPTG